MAKHTSTIATVNLNTLGRNMHVSVSVISDNCSSYRKY